MARTPFRSRSPNRSRDRPIRGARVAPWPLSFSALLLVALALGAGSCASPGSLPTSQSRLISEEEIAQVSVSTMYELVERLRPLWLRPSSARSVTRRTETAVVENGFYVGSLDALRRIPTSGVREVRFLTGSEAAGNVRGVPRGGRAIAAAIVIHRRVD